MKVDLMDAEVFGVALVPLILGLVELCKQSGLPDKWSPVLSVLLGLLAGMFALDVSNLYEGIVVGLALGLSATGLYSGTKNMVRRKGHE